MELSYFHEQTVARKENQEQREQQTKRRAEPRQEEPKQEEPRQTEQTSEGQTQDEQQRKKEQTEQEQLEMEQLMEWSSEGESDATTRKKRLTSNISVQYQYIVHQTGDENKDNHQHEVIDLNHCCITNFS